jgi:hypothetical protein
VMLNASAYKSFSNSPIELMCGAVLCRLQVFSDQNWARLEAHERPLEAIYADGLGWVAAVPCHVMN